MKREYILGQFDPSADYLRLAREAGIKITPPLLLMKPGVALSILPRRLISLAPL
jgi:hypothetical protein